MPASRGGGDRLADAVEVLLLGRAERDADVIVPGLGDEADGVGAGVEERAQAGIVGEADAGPLGHAEGGEGGARCVRFSAKKALSVGLAPG